MKTVQGKSRPLFLVIFGIVFSCIPIAMLAIFAADGEFSFFPIIILGFMGMVGIFVVAWGVAIYYTRSRMGVPDILLSKETLQVGEAFTLNFHHTFKNNMTIENIVICLLFRETATYQQGTDTRTVTHEEVFEEFAMPGGNFRAGHLISNVFNMKIPADGMHTLKVRRNQIQWFIRVEAMIPRLPDFVEEKEIIVLPQLAAS